MAEINQKGRHLVQGVMALLVVVFKSDNRVVLRCHSCYKETKEKQSQERRMRGTLLDGVVGRPLWGLKKEPARIEQRVGIPGLREQHG